MFSLLILGLVVGYMATLFAVAWYQERPATRADLATIPGVGAKKLEAWGDAFLDVIRQY